MSLAKLKTLKIAFVKTLKQGRGEEHSLTSISATSRREESVGTESKREFAPRPAANMKTPQVKVTFVSRFKVP